MSGICGIVNLDGAPVDPELLAKMAAASQFRGPDGLNYWVKNNVGLAHLALHTTPESVREKQPLVNRLGNLVLTADARLDNRPELIEDLLSKGVLDDKEPTDADLILAAYLCWGTQCPEYLLGDFCFALWDTTELRLLLVRDQLGARPCYYYQTDRTIVFASEIKQIRLFPGVSNRLNDRMVAAHIATIAPPASWTFFSDVAQLAPAHALTRRRSDTTVYEYWKLDPTKSIRYKRDEEYAEHFLHLFRQAVTARLRVVSPIGVLLSGGMDSSAVTCTAADHLNRGGQLNRLRAYTFDYTGVEVIREADEQYFARQVASHWDLPLTTIPAHENWPLGDVGKYSMHADTPFCGHYIAMIREGLLAAQRDGIRVLMTGIPGDNQVGGPVFPYADYLRSGRWWRLAVDLIQHGKRSDFSFWQVTRTSLLSPLYQRIFQYLNRHQQDQLDIKIPEWMSGSLRRKACFKEMMAEVLENHPTQFDSLAQEHRYGHLTTTLIGMGASRLEALAASLGMEFRHPWLDVRLFEYPLAIPQEQLVKAGNYKFIVRNAMRELMPEVVRQRHPRGMGPFSLLSWSYREKAASTIRALLENPISAERGYIDATLAASFYERFVSGKIKGEHPLWYTIALELWLRENFTDDDDEPL